MASPHPGIRNLFRKASLVVVCGGNLELMMMMITEVCVLVAENLGLMPVIYPPARPSSVGSWATRVVLITSI